MGNRRADVTEVKAQLSRQVDIARMAYGHEVMEVPRAFVFFGTTNQDKPLGDYTGNRRFWPSIVRSHCDIQGLIRNRDQLWAEASFVEGQGHSIELPEEYWPEAQRIQEEHSIENPLEETHDNHLGDMEGMIRSDDAWKILGIQPAQRRMHYEPFGAAMRTLGWERGRRTFLGSKCRVYYRGSETSSYRPIIVRSSPGEGIRVA
ncbi:MAG: virulence-associated E family protein [Alphaproteobacteria bacterium]|nr:virulence-associated E family protein [Alphaproteobacteria bacterium]